MSSRNRTQRLTGLTLLLLAGPLLLAQQDASVHLQVKAGTPLRLYIPKRVFYHKNAPVQAKLAEPVWSFDRVVIPAGVNVTGQIDQLTPVPKLVRTAAIVRGDFTPLKSAYAAFHSIQFPDGHSMTVDTQSALGLASIYTPSRPAKQAKPGKPGANPNAKFTRLRGALKQQAQAQVNARTRGLLEFVRGPNKREWLESFLLAKLPYHPQWYRSGTRFDAVLRTPLEFGDVRIPSNLLPETGGVPVPGAPAQIRFLSTLTSKTARIGDPVSAVLSQPSLSASNRMVLPEGTRLTGKVTQCRAARLFHRGGRLRFVFDTVEPPALASAPARAQAVQAQLTAAEQTSGSLQIDSEGTAKASESKTRFLRPAIAGIIAAKTMDSDEGRQTASEGANANRSGASLGGFSGFGLFGTAIAQGPRTIGMALSFYGLAWSAYSTIVSRGREVTFVPNSVMSVQFGGRGPAR